MIVRFFKSNAPATLGGIAIVALTLRILAYRMAAAPADLDHSMPLYEVAGNLFRAPLLQAVVAVVLTILNALILNYVINEHEVLEKQTYLPALFYVVLTSSHPSLLAFHASQFATCFLLIALNKLLITYRKDIAFSQVFDAGLLVAIASLFYFPSVYMLPLIFISLTVLRPFIWREWAIATIGFITPYLFALTYYYWYDSIRFFIHNSIVSSLQIKQTIWPMDFGDYAVAATVGLMSVFSLTRLLTGSGTRKLKSKKAMTILVWFSLLAVLSLTAAPHIAPEHFRLLAIPLSVILASYMLSLKKSWVTEVLFLLLLAAIIYNQLKG